MNKQEIELKVRQILAQKLDMPADNITANSKLVDDLGMDSFAAVELGFEVEEQYAIEIPDADIALMKTVEDVTTYIERKVAAKA